MEEQIKKEFAQAVKEGITKTLKNNPGIEKYLDWFTVLAPINEEVEQTKQDLKKETLV